MRALHLLILLALTADARAERIVAGPDDCAAPANAPPYIAEDVQAEDLNPWRAAAEEIAPLIDRTVADHPQADRIFIRLRADPETGETLAPPEHSCDERP